jgi:hypothetical protein
MAELALLKYEVSSPPQRLAAARYIFCTDDCYAAGQMQKKAGKTPDYDCE